MNNKTIAVTASIENPDTTAILSKNVIDISISNFDISASGYTDVVKLNFQETETAVYIENLEQTTAVTGSLYYTPIYAEKINYQIWKNRINKSFTELGVI